MNINDKYMKRALQLAARGRGYTSPNPMVGAVIVHNDTIIGEGYHRRCGEPHAEVNAVNSVTDKELLKDSTIYVTLEPCSHYGKTPPCAQLIIDSNIPRVVIGCLDPFEKVSGRGVKMLQEHGIEVVTGVLEAECKSLNSRFMTAHTLRRPWVTLKWAQSSDMFMDHKRDKNAAAARFSTPLTSALTHRLRSLHDGIIAASGTIIADNPSLNVRLFDGNSPRVIALDRRGLIPADAAIFNADKPVIYVSAAKRQDLHNAEIIEVSPDATIADYLNALYNHGITSVLVEGGATLLQQFIDSRLWDIARVETHPEALGENGSVSSPVLGLTPIKNYSIDGNSIDIYSQNSTILPNDLDFCNFV